MNPELKYKIVEALSKEENFIHIQEVCKTQNWEFAFNDFVSANYEKCGKDHNLWVSFECSYTEANGNVTNTVENFRIQIGLQTKSGYFSSKKLPISFVNEDSLTVEELEAAMEYYNKDTKSGAFDPFFAENNYRRNNAAGWVAVAQKLQPDCRG